MKLSHLEKKFIAIVLTLILIISFMPSTKTAEAKESEEVKAQTARLINTLGDVSADTNKGDNHGRK